MSLSKVDFWLTTSSLTIRKRWLRFRPSRFHHPWTGGRESHKFSTEPESEYSDSGRKIFVTCKMSWILPKSRGYRRPTGRLFLLVYNIYAVYKKDIERKVMTITNSRTTNFRRISCENRVHFEKKFLNSGEKKTQDLFKIIIISNGNHIEIEERVVYMAYH